MSSLSHSDDIEPDSSKQACSSSSSDEAAPLHVRLNEWHDRPIPYRECHSGHCLNADGAHEAISLTALLENLTHSVRNRKNLLDAFILAAKAHSHHDMTYEEDGYMFMCVDPSREKVKIIANAVYNHHPVLGRYGVDLILKACARLPSCVKYNWDKLVTHRHRDRSSRQDKKEAPNKTPARQSRTPDAPRKRPRPRRNRPRRARAQLQFDDSNQQPVLVLNDEDMPESDGQGGDPFVNVFMDLFRDNNDCDDGGSIFGDDDDDGDDVVEPVDDDPESESEVDMDRDDFVEYINLQTSVLRAQSQALAVMPMDRTRTRAKMLVAITNQSRRLAQLTPVEARLFERDPAGRGRRRRAIKRIKVSKLPERSGDRMYTVNERMRILGFNPANYDVARVGMRASELYQQVYKTYPLKEERPTGRGEMLAVNVYNEASAQKTADVAIRRAARGR